MSNDISRRQRVVLAALASDPGADFAPVQIQKLFFLLDERAQGLLGGKQFNFQPYNYGPFDVEVYNELDRLKAEGLAHVTPGQGGNRRYSLTPAGSIAGKAELESYQPDLAEFMAATARWVRSMSFAELVGSIYRAYPEMRERSIFVNQ